MFTTKSILSFSLYARVRHIKFFHKFQSLLFFNYKLCQMNILQSHFHIIILKLCNFMCIKPNLNIVGLVSFGIKQPQLMKLPQTHYTVYGM